MQYPLISEYIDAIRSAEDNFDKLTNLRPVLDSNGNPVMSGGNFAVVFKMKDVETERLYAVKCFTREQEERAERYHEIIKVLRKIESPYFVSTHYYDKELFVDNTQSDDSEFPVLVMDWVDGMPLDVYMKTIEGSQFKRELLAKQFQELVCWLLPKHFAHGDIKPDNIIIKEDGSIVLVDYDGMFVPSLRGKEALEMGTPMYQHPGRTLSFFNEYIDDYAAVMLLTLLNVNALTAIDYELFLTDNTIVFFKHFEHLLNHPTIAPLLSAYIMVATFGRIDRQQLSCLLSDNSNFDYNKESILQDFARQGDTVAMNELARLYRNGVYVPENISKAMQWYTLSQLLGNIDAICGLCTCISNNNDFIKENEIIQDNLKKCRITFAYCREGEMLRYDKKHEQAILLYRKAAEYGSAAAQNRLAGQYYRGEGVDKDLEQAIYWWKKAAEAGNTNAQNSLAGKYYFGEGVDKNLEQAVYWWKKAAEAGNAYAQNILAKLYYKGEGVGKNLEQAVYWWRKAAEAGNTNAQGCLAGKYHFGEGVGKNIEQAIYWWRKAAEAGNSDAQNILAMLYYKGEGVGKDFEQAMYWWRKAAEAGNADAQYYLACLYYDGEGVDKNLEQALHWWKKAAEAGNSDAQNSLAWKYYEGEGVDKNLEQALHWWKKAAEAGNTYAQNSLAWKYYIGEGVDKNLEQALHWWKKAAEAGNTNAQYSLAMRYYYGEGVDKNTEQAIYWWRKAAEAGNADAQYNLACLYSKGERVDQNIEQAVYWWKKSAETGKTKAMRILAICHFNGIGVERSIKMSNYWLKKASIPHKKGLTIHKVLSEYQFVKTMTVEQFKKSQNDEDITMRINDDNIVLECGSVTVFIVNNTLPFNPLISCICSRNKNAENDNCIWIIHEEGVGCPILTTF